MNRKTKQNTQYKLYALRLWREPMTNEWRIAIQPSDGSRPHGLATTADLAAYVQQLIDSHTNEVRQR